jgi:hypothetical protein
VTLQVTVQLVPGAHGVLISVVALHPGPGELCRVHVWVKGSRSALVAVALSETVPGLQTPDVHSHTSTRTRLRTIEL